MPNRNLIYDTINNIASLNSLPEIQTKFADAISKFGFDFFGINGLPPPTADSDPVILTECAPKNFREFFVRERLYSFDHIAVHARAMWEPFCFADAPPLPGESGRRDWFLDALQTFNVGKGFLIPLGRPAPVPTCAWLAGENPEFHAEARLALQVITLFAANKIQVLCGSCENVTPSRALSKRERDVLQWIAAGKTSWEVSVISGLSERTVNAVISDAMTKLDAVTRVQAVVNAIRRGDIGL